MLDLSRDVLRAYIEWHSRGVRDVEGNAYRQVRESYPDLEEGRFAQELDGLRISGYLARTRSRRDGAGEVVGPGSLIPTPNGHVEARR